MTSWDELYVELAKKISDKLQEVAWVDLWHDQVQYLTEELTFPAPAVFIGFQTLDIEDKGEKIQNCNTQVDFYLFYETFSDTYEGAYNQASALDFLKTLTSIHALFHATSGESYSSMRRIDQKREESGGAGNLYRISFACMVEDASAMDVVENVPVSEINLSNEPFVKESATDSEPLYHV